MPYLGIICHQRIQSGKFHAQCKKIQFKTETAFFRLTFKKLLTYLKPEPTNLSNCKISKKTKQKYLNSGPKMPYLGIFRLEF